MLVKYILIVASASAVLARPTALNVLTAIRNLTDEELVALEVMLGLTQDVTADDEEMQGDQPQPGNETVLDAIKSSWDMNGGRYAFGLIWIGEHVLCMLMVSASSFLPTLVFKDREQRIKAIMQQVLQFAGRDVRSNSSLPPASRKQSDTIDRIFDQVRNIQYNSDIFTEKVQNFFPACDLPRNTDEEMWNTGQAMKLHFDLMLPVPAPGSTVQIQSAKLRLYKMSQEAPIEVKHDSSVATRYPVTSLEAMNQDSKIRVSAYWYTRSLKRNRVRRKLLDSMMLPLYTDERTELDVKAAVVAWKELGKNFGLAVEVENEDGVLLQASKYFVTMNCSKEAAPAKSMPLFLVDAIQRENKTSITQYPSIEVSTIEFPKSTEGSSYGVVKYPIDSVPRFRHSHHRQSSTTTPANESIEQIVWDDPTDR